MPAFVTVHRLRFNDCDPVGHVNNAVYAVFMEAGRTDLIQAAGLHGPDHSMVVARLEIDFRREMTWPGEVQIETAVTRIGGKSIHLRHRIRSAGEVRAHGLSVLVAIGKQTRRAVALDQGWHDRLAPWTGPLD